jgi:hypothetical protein
MQGQSTGFLTLQASAPSEAKVTAIAVEPGQDSSSGSG